MYHSEANTTKENNFKINKVILHDLTTRIHAYLRNVSVFSALNDLYTMTLMSYDLDNIIFGLLIPENPYVDTKNLLLA